MEPVRGPETAGACGNRRRIHDPCYLRPRHQPFRRPLTADPRPRLEFGVRLRKAGGGPHAPMKSRLGRPSGAARRADTSTQRHEVNRNMGQALRTAPTLSQFVTSVNRSSWRLSFVPNRLTALGVIHRALTSRRKVLATKREPISPGWYRRYGWYSKEKSPYEVVPTRVPGGTDIAAHM